MSVAPSDILELWFGGHDPDDPATGDRQSKLWWGHDEATDRDLQERFAQTHQAATQGQLDGWADAPSGRVALVLMFDQLSRMLHRDTPGAFAQDAVARRWVQAATERGADRDLPFFHRVFLYMPLMHSEDLRDQERCCRLFEALRDENEGDRADKARSYGGFAVRHRDIIARFGRFPHRNAILGRPSSAEELRFLEGPGSSF